MRSLLAAAAIIAVLATACGGSSGSGQPAGSTKVTLTEFKFDPSSITVPHGKVVFFLVNSGSVQHDMAIRDSTGNRLALSELISAGDTSVFTVNNMDAGTYTIFCTQQGHETSGMHGTLTVT